MFLKTVAVGCEAQGLHIAIFNHSYPTL